MTKTVAICTLGCKVNSYESEAVIEQFVKNGYSVTGFDKVSDVYIINTCTVTHLGDRKSRQMIRRTKQLNPDAVLVVMGCYSQTAPEDVNAIPEVDIVLGNTEKANAYHIVEEFLENHQRIFHVTDISNEPEFEELSVTSYEGKTRAFLKVQDGCNNFCTYCIIPYARGRIRSRKLENCVQEAKRLSENGYHEIVLVGIHLASYGKEKENAPLLIDLLSAIHKIDGISRIRMGSLEPTLFDEDFIERLKSLPKICRHFHLSMQSGCDETLRRMNRKYTTKEYAEAVKNIRKAFPDAAITTDILTGFPGETEEEFLKTLQFVEKIRFADAHVFKYSVRRGTRAAKMEGQVPADVKEARSQKLIHKTQKSRDAFLKKQIGNTVSVLFERKHKGISGLYEGKTDHYITVLAKSETDIEGLFFDVFIQDVKDGYALGELIVHETE